MTYPPPPPRLRRLCRVRISHIKYTRNWFYDVCTRRPDYHGVYLTSRSELSRFVGSMLYYERCPYIIKLYWYGFLMKKLKVLTSLLPLDIDIFLLTTLIPKLMIILIFDWDLPRPILIQDQKLPVYSSRLIMKKMNKCLQETHWRKRQRTAANPTCFLRRNV